MVLKVAIIGRPNVGKSTLFNRLVGRKIAIVHDQPGVTRDRKKADAKIQDLPLEIVDTAGYEYSTEDNLETRMWEQTKRAIEEADAALFLFDARDGVQPYDEHLADLVRRIGKPVVLLANKCEGKFQEDSIHEAYRLGLGQPIAFSAEHGLGLLDLYDALKKVAENIPEESEPEAGVTRDAITSSWVYEGRKINLVDTAGLRKHARIEDSLEKMSAAATKHAAFMAQVVVLVLDADGVLDKQDLTIARQVLDEGRALVIALNKWDIANRKEALDKLNYKLETSLTQAEGVPTVTISALRKENLDKLMRAVFKVYDRWNKRIPTSPLNNWFSDILDNNPPPLGKNKRRIKLRYITQAKTRPPSFYIFSSNPEGLPDSYLRYLINSLRETFDLRGIPLRMTVRKGDNPYAEKKPKKTLDKKNDIKKRR